MALMSKKRQQFIRFLASSLYVRKKRRHPHAPAANPGIPIAINVE
jgi:hypothetical protein